jgi:hypothetical protein
MLSTGANSIAVRRLEQRKPDLGAFNGSIATFSSRQSFDEDFDRLHRLTGDCSLKLETADIDRDSGISGDRNSASSTSSGMSVESSLTSLNSADDYAGVDRVSCSSSTMSCSSSSLEQIGRSNVRNNQRSSGLESPGITTLGIPVVSSSDGVVARFDIEAGHQPNRTSENYGCTIKRRDIRSLSQERPQRMVIVGDAKNQLNAGMFSLLFIGVAG